MQKLPISSHFHPREKLTGPLLHLRPFWGCQWDRVKNTQCIGCTGPGDKNCRFVGLRRFRRATMSTPGGGISDEGKRTPADIRANNELCNIQVLEKLFTLEL